MVVITNGVSVAYGVLYNDSPGANTTLVVGSVACDKACTVVQGNTAGDTAVNVRIDSIAAPRKQRQQPVHAFDWIPARGWIAACGTRH